MDLVAFHLDEVAEDRAWFKELADYNDPESLLIAKETEAELLNGLSVHDLALLMQEITMQEYCNFTEASISTGYRRLADVSLVVDQLLGAGNCC